MRIRSLTELVDFLDKESSWRKKELSTLKLIISRSRSHQQGVLIRMGVCILYAHWEGFIKNSATSYISFVTTRGLRYRDVTTNFVAMAVKSQIMVAGRSRKPTLHNELVEKLMDGQSTRLRINWEDAIDTNSNLSSDVLSEILSGLGLDIRAYATKGPIIDQRLLATRNVVAHGGYLAIERDDYESLHDEIIQLIEWFKVDLENAAVQMSYRRI